MPIQCVLFDHDDTLLPTFAWRSSAFDIALRQVLNRDLDGATVFRTYNGRTIEHIADELTGGDAALAEELVRVYRDIYYSTNGQPLEPFPGIPMVLEQLRAAGVRVAVVTSKIRWGAEEELKRAGIHDFIEHVIGADDVSKPKPAPEPVLRALDVFGVAPRSTVMVGDTAADVLAAQSAGALSGAALWGTQDREVLLGLDPTYAFEQPEHILKLT
jgi:HAD superfamily hydrolase (TIGR01509 family)